MLKVKSENEVAQSCPTLSDPMDCSLPGSSVHGIFQARVLEWGVIAFSITKGNWNAKGGHQEIPGVTGKFGLGVQNEAGQRLIEFCQLYWPRECTGRSKHALATPQERTLHMDITRVPNELWTDIHDIIQETGSKSILKKKNAKKQNGCLRRPYK